MNKHRLWLCFIILVAFALRLTFLGEQSLWYDEGVTWLLSQMSLPELIEWTAADIQPPLYYLIIWINNFILSDSEWALRFPSALFNTMTIPLIYILTRQLFPRRRNAAPLLAAVLFTFSPLMVYYSQEARMYTLLIFEATLASYLLLKIIHSPTPYSLLPTTYSLLYALTAVAALYTHYFAAFLLAAHLLYIIFVLWQRHWPKVLIARSLQMFGLIILLFAPWLPTLLSRLGDDPSYWPGSLKLHEALRQVLISFTTGETVFEQTAWWLTLGFLAILIAGGLWGLLNKRLTQAKSQHSPPNIHPSSFIPHSSSLIPSTGSGQALHPSSLLLLWLLLPITLILLLSYSSPKFNPRYAMLSYPAFILLLTAALNQFLQPVTRRATHYALRFTFYVSLSFILSTSTFSLYNWFADPRFSKDDFKALAKFVQERQAADETVLISSGHMFPVWVYYYGWENWTPLPQMERLDVNRVTDLSIADDIAKAIEGKGGVWLVSWQDEVIDPNGIVPFWLDLIGQRPIDAGDFWGVNLEHWRLVSNRIESLHESPIKQPAPNSRYNFAKQIDLLGMTQLSDTEIVLFWRPRQSLPDDLSLTLDLTDEAGFDWDRDTAVGRPGAYFYPPSRWPVGQIVMTRHQLPWKIGTPPGAYIVEIGLGSTAPVFTGWDILDEQERPQRRTALLESVKLSHLIQTDDIFLDQTPLVDFFPVIAVQDSTLSSKSAEPGDRVLLTLLWQAGDLNHDDVSVAFDLVDAGKQTFRIGSSPTPSRHFNLPRWRPGNAVLGQYWLDLPPDAVSGPASLQLRLINTGANAYDKVFPLAQLDILPTERNFTPPEAIDMPLEADFSGQTTLIGANCSTWTGTDCHTAPGQPVTFTLYWRANAPLDTNYTIFTHLLGPDVTPLINADHAPPKPTQGWVTGEIIADTVTLNIPADLPPGDYLIEVGLYDAADPAFPRLPLNTGETRVILSQPLVVE
jgi:4-amino-4-deoxy-L-arabinose transferase-like glycosyltransferase